MILFAIGLIHTVNGYFATLCQRMDWPQLWEQSGAVEYWCDVQYWKYKKG